jgi:hypothetical protein
MARWMATMRPLHCHGRRWRTVTYYQNETAIVDAASCCGMREPSQGSREHVRSCSRTRIDPGRACAWQHVLTRVAAATRAKPSFRAGQLEPLLVELEAGNLDLVVGGRFAPDTPWKKRVNLGVPLVEAKTAGRSMAGRIAERNGENAWISLIDRETRAALGS